MSQTINLTEAGRKFLQLHNMQSQHKINLSSSSGSLPTINQPTIPHECQLRQLPLRLNKLYSNKIIQQASRQLKQSIKSLQKQMIKDLGYSNSYTNKRAQKLVKQIYRKNMKQNEDNNLIMQLSKNRNYLSRINYLYIQQNNKYENIRKNIKDICNKDNLQ